MSAGSIRRAASRRPTCAGGRRPARCWPARLLPNRSGDVRASPGGARYQGGKVEFRVDKTGIVHAPIGKWSFETAKLVANAHALVDSVVKAKPAAAKGKYLKSVTVSSTMGPGVRIDTTAVETVAH